MPERRVKKFVALQEEELASLREFLKARGAPTPYHSTEFAEVLSDCFTYPNQSLVVIQTDGKICGYVPQWEKGGILESVPWRDRGGPVFADSDALNLMIDETKQIVQRASLKGFLWKDFTYERLPHESAFLNAEISLDGLDESKYRAALDKKERNTIKFAEKSGLRFEAIASPSAKQIDDFYELFVENRKRLGVPVFQANFFHSYFRRLPSDDIRLLNVFQDGALLSSLILLLQHSTRAIDAYSASHELASRVKANDFMIYKTVCFCIENGIQKFDFGSDSPRQESLMAYKRKWFGKDGSLGSVRSVPVTTFGKAKEGDHNSPIFAPIKFFIRKMPRWSYMPFSRAVVK